MTPSSTTSGTEPWRIATTGVPQAMASIITSPNGSGHVMGKRNACACANSSRLRSSLTSPSYTIWSPSMCGSTFSSKYSRYGSCSTPAMMSLWPSRLAVSMLWWKPLASQTRPKASR